MSITNSWPTVSNIVDNQTRFCSTDINPIITALQQRTDTLKSTIENLSNIDRQGYIMPVSKLSSTCAVGDFVAYKPEDGIIYPAVAAFTTSYNKDGSQSPSWSSYVLGLLISKDSSSATGTILCSGWISDDDLITTVIGASKVSGNYSLSSTSAGKVVRTTDSIRNINVQCCFFSADSNGSGRLYINIRTPEYGGHSHSCVVIPGGSWVPATVVTGAGSQLKATGELLEVLSSNPSNGSLFMNGEELTPGSALTGNTEWIVVVVKEGMTDFGTQANVEDGYYLVTKTPVPADSNNVCTYHATTAFTTPDPAVRSLKVKHNCPILEVSKSTGDIYIYPVLDPIEENKLSGTGVISVTNEGVVTGPVVQRLEGGIGVSVIPTEDITTGAVLPGVYTIQSESIVQTYIDFTVCNLNGALIGAASDDDVSYILPASINSSLTGVARVPHYSSNVAVKGEIILIMRGNTNATPGVTVRVTIQRMPTASSESSVAGCIIASLDSEGSWEGATTDSNKYYFFKYKVMSNNEEVVFPADALVKVTLIRDGYTAEGANDLHLLSISLRLK